MSDGMDYSHTDESNDDSNIAQDDDDSRKNSDDDTSPSNSDKDDCYETTSTELISNAKTFLTDSHTKLIEEDIPQFETVVLKSADVQMIVDDSDSNSSSEPLSKSISTSRKSTAAALAAAAAAAAVPLARSTRKNRQKTYTDELTYDSGSENEKRPRRERKVVEKEKEKDKIKEKNNTGIPSLAEYRKTGQQFLQATDCRKLAKTLGKCRECMDAADDEASYTYCRFYKYRKLRYDDFGKLIVAGFSHPLKEASVEDIALWLPDDSKPPRDLDMNRSRFILAQVGDQFCDLLAQERNAKLWTKTQPARITINAGAAVWKRVIIGVREMCDVCETTLFNYHWSCGKCGFVVCLDCYKDRQSGTHKVWGTINRKEVDSFSWLLCTNQFPHDIPALVLTQIIPGNAMEEINKLMHETRVIWNIPSYCNCSLDKQLKQEFHGNHKKDMAMKLIKEEWKRNNIIELELREVNKLSKNSRGWLDDLVEKEKIKQEELKRYVKVEKKEPTAEEVAKIERMKKYKNDFLLQLEESYKLYPSDDGDSVFKQIANKPVVPDANILSLEQNDFKSNIDEDIKMWHHSLETTHHANDLKFVDPLANAVTAGTNLYLPIRIMTSHSLDIYPNVPHSWLCDGKLLRLEDPLCTGNVRIFQEQWKRGQPVIISNLPNCIDMKLWRPESFSHDFGEQPNDLINCITGNIVPNQPMKLFWDGFDDVEKRLKDRAGNPMLLKLKDWPPGEDFAEIMPIRFENLMKGLPLPDYTQRSGKFNLASRLPDCFVKPDLGPKMYNAYGSAVYPSKGTTNLHLDISDAVNLMVYVGLPKDKTAIEHMREAYRAIDEAGCDIITRRRVRDTNELPGALWHIFAPRDADKIRDLLNKISIERGERIEPNHDPIHDQVWYLDGNLRKRLYNEYMVEGYAIAQCLGDAVFIPAGAPHQVRNLHNCIKVAEDFVSPENVVHCFHLTQQFRNLSDTHSNHEDKLQIKNIIYHAVKDSVSCLSHLLKKELIIDLD